jgi:pimeloyl-ACP methyl ester carboxylesterase
MWMKKTLMSLMLAGASLAPGLAIAADGLQACRVPGIKYEIQCGKVSRLLDPARPQGPRIDVHYAVVPAMARNKRPDPVFLLAGGPGQSAIELAGAALGSMGSLGRLHAQRDLVFVDQRGTGRSAPLVCPQPPLRTLADMGDTPLQQRELASCRAALGKLPYIQQPSDLGFFTTTLAMQDLDAVRQALGAEQINLIGVSYGTRAALEYLRQFPQAVRRSVLDGVAPPDMVLPATVGADNQAALQALWASCGGQTACAQAFPRLAADWAALKASLPKAVTVRHPATGEAQSLTLTREVLMALLRGPLYSPVLSAGLPQAISDAAAGRYEGLFGLASATGFRGRAGLAAGMHYSVICAEDAPRLSADTSAAQSANQSATAPDFADDFERQYRRVCADWPRGAVPSAFYTLAAAPSPVLLLSGGLDPVTPPRHAERVAKALGEKARSVVVPNAGHGVLTVSCMAEPVREFIAAQTPAQALAVDAACAQQQPRPAPYVAPRLPRATPAQEDSK